MPFALVLAGLLLIVTGVKDTYKEFGAQVASDFTGSQNFVKWFVALAIIGAVGYVPALQRPSRYFMALVLIGIFLANSGVFAQFTAALNAGPQSPGDTAPSASLPGLGDFPQIGTPTLEAPANTTSENARQNAATVGKIVSNILPFFGL